MFSKGEIYSIAKAHLSFERKIGQFKIFAEFSESLYLVEEWIIGCSFIEQQQQQQKNPSAQGQRSLLSNPI